MQVILGDTVLVSNDEGAGVAAVGIIRETVDNITIVWASRANIFMDWLETREFSSSRAVNNGRSHGESLGVALQVTSSDCYILLFFTELGKVVCAGVHLTCGVGTLAAAVDEGTEGFFKV